MEVFKLLGSIFVNNDEANKNIEETDKKAEGLGKKFGEGIKTAGKWGAAIGAGALAGGAALLGMAKKGAEATDEIDKMSQKIGISRQGFQEYSYILSQNGTDVAVLQRGFKTLNDRMTESVEGTGKGVEAFNALGLSATDLNGNLKTQEQMFEESAKALMGMPAGAEKSALAFDLFGKAGQELMPLLNGSAEGMDELRQAANDMGLVLSDEAVDAGAAFTDTMDNIERSLGAVVSNIGVKVMPMFDNFLNWVLDHMPEIQMVIGAVFDAIGGFVGVVVKIFETVLMPAFEIILEWTKKNWPAIQKIIEAVIDLIVGVIEAFVALFTKVWEKWGKEITAIVTKYFDAMKVVVDTVINVIKGIIETVMALIKGDWEGVWEGIKGILKTVWEGMAKLLPSLIDLLFTVLRGSFTVFKDIGKKMFEMVWDGMKSIWGSISSWVGEKVSWLTDKLMFWKKGTDEMDTGGNSDRGSKGINRAGAVGIKSIPSDGYRVLAHKGERLLNKEEADSYNQGGDNSNQELTINTPIYLDGKQLTTVTSRVQFQNNKGKARALGVITT